MYMDGVSLMVEAFFLAVVFFFFDDPAVFLFLLLLLPAFFRGAFFSVLLAIASSLPASSWVFLLAKFASPF